MRSSGNLEDREASGPALGRGGGLKLGGVGFIAVVAISWFLGLNPLDVLESLQGGQSSSPPTQSAPPPAAGPGTRDETKEFIARILGDTEDTWSALFFEDLSKRFGAPGDFARAY